MSQVCKTHNFYKCCRNIIESQMLRISARVKKSLNRPQRHTSIHGPDLRG